MRFLSVRPIAGASAAFARLCSGLLARRLVRALVLGLAVLPCAAHAQLAGSVSLSTSEMFRGESISDSRPVLTVGASLDSGTGLFAGTSASVAAAAHGPQITSLVQYAGYAKRVGGVTAEVGAIHRRYLQVLDRDYRRSFFEVYAGLACRGIKARIYLSPDYLVDGQNSYYAEVNARLLRIREWTLEGHAGLSLIPYELALPRRGLRNYQDWRMQVSRPAGRLFIAVGVNATNYPVYSASGKAKVFASISTAF